MKYLIYVGEKAKVILGDILFNFQRQNFYTKELDLISTSYGPGRYDKSYEQKVSLSV